MKCAATSTSTRTKDAAGILGRITTGMLTKVGISVTADDLAALLLPELLTNRLLVFDDIERKGGGFSVDALLGFVESYRQRHETRFLFLLNTDKLQAEREMWDTLREKVVDREIHFNPRPEESFEIACEDCSSEVYQEIKRVVALLRVTNIRVIRRIVTIADQFFPPQQQYSDHRLRRLLPSLVLLALIHFRALPRGPAKDFVLGGEADNSRYPKNLVEEWRIQMRSIGIESSDKLEQLIQQYLETGLLDPVDLEDYFRRFDTRVQAELAAKAIDECLVDIRWNPRNSVDQIRSKAADIAALVPHITRDKFDLVVRTLEELGFRSIGEELSSNCGSRWQSSNSSSKSSVLSDAHAESNDKVECSDARSNAYNQTQQPSLMDALMLACTGDPSAIVHSATISECQSVEYLDALRNASATRLRTLLTSINNWSARPDKDSLMHDVAMRAIAARRILQEGTGHDDERLLEILRRELIASDGANEVAGK